MTIPLRQSTASQEIPLGHFLDSTDGDTEETGLTIANTDIKLWKMGATTLVNKNSGGATHISNGIFYCVLDATDTTTLGSLIAFVHVSGALAIRVECEVMTANRYDSLVAGTDVLQVDLTQIGGVAQSATDLKDFTDTGYDPSTHRTQARIKATDDIDLSATQKASVNAECDTALSDYDSPTKAESDASFNLVIADTEDIQTQVGTAGVGLTDLGGMSTGMKGEVNVECDTALTDYDAPTKTDVDASFNALNNVSSADVTAACTSSLNTYDPPTKTEMDTSFNSVITEVNANETKIDALNDLSSANVTTACTSALNTYDPPTKTEMDVSFNALNDVSSSDVNAACDTALTDYGAPTKAEMDTSFNSVITEIGDNETKIDALPTKIEVDASFNALNDLSSANVTAACTSSLNTYDAPTKAEMDTSFNAVIADTEDLQTQIGVAGVGLDNIGGMSVAMMGEVQTEVNDGLVALNLDHLVKDSVDTSFAATVNLNSVIGHMAGVGGSATYDRTTESAEAIRNRGDAAWTTGGAGSISEILNVQALVPNSIDLADTATVRVALGLTNMVDDLPSTTEITPGTITIDRKAIGATSWTTVVDASACSELTGLIYYDEVFDTSSGYAAGDSIRITFKSQKITVDANDFEITGTDGWVFQTHIREAMVGTSNAATKTEMDTSFNSVITEVNANETKIDIVDTVVDAIKAKTDNLPSGLAKNVAVPKFDIYMVLSSDHVSAATGKTVTGTISKDGGAFVSLTNAITEVSGGMYTIADGLTQAERNADVSTLRFTASGCDARMITIYSS
jgi:hypothetical protein